MENQNINVNEVELEGGASSTEQIKTYTRKYYIRKRVAPGGVPTTECKKSKDIDIKEENKTAHKGDKEVGKIEDLSFLDNI